MDNKNNQMDATADLHIPDNPPSDNKIQPDTNTAFLNLTLSFPPGHRRRSHSADSANDFFNRSTSAGASTSGATPFSFIYTPKFPHNIPVLPDSVPAEDVPADVPVRRRPRRNCPDTPPTITPPYPWAGNHRCSVLTMADLHSRSIFVIRGDVHCVKCDLTYEIEYNVEEKFNELSEFVTRNVQGMRQRAHAKWMYPVSLNCGVCNEEKCVKPVFAEKKRSINWLFLLLGQMLGFCNLYQLKYFCKNTLNHRTGSKDRVLFIAYMNLCRQVDPDRAFFV